MTPEDAPQTHIDQGRWQSRRECGTETAALFYPPSGTHAEHKETKLNREARAKEICGRCAVREECLDYALAHNEYGIWGGTGEDERRSIKRYHR